VNIVIEGGDKENFDVALHKEVFFSINKYFRFVFKF
jgi:hypothetical protein